MTTKNVTLTVVIPTCDRSVYLKHALATCVKQQHPYLEILISDNASQDDTKSVVESFPDPRIRYINPGQRLSMASHFEFALDHVQTDYVMIIGDDDGLLDYSVDLMVDIIKNTRTEAIRWRKNAYHWPDYPVSGKQNMLKIRFGTRLKKVNAYEALRKVAKGDLWYGGMPGIYHSCVSVTAVRKIKQYTNGLVFAHSTPDVWLCIMMGGLVNSYIDSDLPLSIPGSSGKSNGANIFFTNSGIDIFEQFNSLAKQTNKSVICSDPTLSIDLIVLDLLHAASPFLAVMDRKIKVYDLKFMISALRRARSGSEDIWRRVKEDVFRRVRSRWYTYFYYKYVIERQQFNGQAGDAVSYGLNNNILTIDASLLGINNIYDASLFCSKLLKAEAHKAFKNIIKI